MKDYDIRKIDGDSLLDLNITKDTLNNLIIIGSSYKAKIFRDKREINDSIELLNNIQQNGINKNKTLDIKNAIKCFSDLEEYEKAAYLTKQLKNLKQLNH